MLVALQMLEQIAWLADSRFADHSLKKIINSNVLSISSEVTKTFIFILLQQMMHVKGTLFLEIFAFSSVRSDLNQLCIGEYDVGVG